MFWVAILSLKAVGLCVCPESPWAVDIELFAFCQAKAEKRQEEEQAGDINHGLVNSKQPERTELILW